MVAPTFARGPPPPPDGAPRNASAGLPRNGSPVFFLRDKAAPRGQAVAMFRLTREGATARLLLDRPEARNAIPAAGWAALAHVVGEAADARLLVISGAGGAFCAGADLSDFVALQGDEAARRRFREDMREALGALAGLPIPTIALIDGPCFGAGVALAMACDLRLATPAARFAITPAKLGISYPQEDVHRLVRLVGPGQAARLLLTALPIDGAEAARIGLVELCDAEEGPIVDAILANDRESLAALKRAVSLDRRTDAEQDARFDALIGGAALTRRLEALRRK